VLCTSCRSGNIEEKVMVLKDKKAGLFASVVGGGFGFAELSADDFRGLLDLPGRTSRELAHPT